MSFQNATTGFLQHITADQLYVSKANAILTSDFSQSFRILNRLPTGAADRAISANQLLARFRRAMINHITVLGDRLVVIGFSRIWCLDKQTGELMGEPAPIKGSRPLALCVCDEGFYYGEYRNNPERSKIGLFNSKDGLRWNEIRSFDNIRHIHGVYYDEYSDALWMTTGDRDEESGIWVSGDRFRTIDKAVGGSQQTRAIQLLFTDSHVYFGSDTPLKKNYIYRIDKNRGQMQRLVEVEGSVFWGCKVGDKLFFSTAVEPSEINKSRDACIWGSADGEHWKCITRYCKDIWPMKLFQYGQIFFPSGKNETPHLFFTPFATKKHGIMQSLKVTDVFTE